MKLKIILALTAMASGRAMTLAFVARAGDGGVGDPPKAWLMPLIGDAVIGIGAVLVLILLLWRRTPMSWLLAVVWNALGAFDAIAAFIVEISAPWPEFFMLEVFGRSMFFAAAALHFLNLYLLSRSDVLDKFRVSSNAPLLSSL